MKSSPLHHRKVTMSIARIILAGMVSAALAGCDELHVTGSQLPIGTTRNLLGVWTGVEEITTIEDIASNAPYGDRGERGFSFPVALSLSSDGRFQLWASALTQGTQYGPCQGIYRKRGNSLEFFSDRHCRALPLPRYTLGSVLPRGLTLEASTANSMTTGAANVRVRLILDR
jgi:hypothetical protein